MALTEFVAIETAYQALAALDPPARTRALAWLSDALKGVDPLAEAAGSAAEPAVRATPATSNQRLRPETARATRGATKRAPATTAAAATAPAATAPAKTAPAKKSTAGAAIASRGRGRPAKTAAVAEARAYRRMPPNDEVVAAYYQVGTINELADFFGVPRHTANGWLRRLRSEGYDLTRAA